MNKIQYALSIKEIIKNLIGCFYNYFNFKKKEDNKFFLSTFNLLFSFLIV